MHYIHFFFLHRSIIFVSGDIVNTYTQITFYIYAWDSLVQKLVYLHPYNIKIILIKINRVLIFYNNI